MTSDHEEPQPPILSYFELTKGNSGATTIRQVSLTGFQSDSLGGLAAPSWIRNVSGEFQNVSFVWMPIGWVGEWHESPHPQWVVALQGRWFIETQDGARVEMGPGELHWGADQATNVIDGHLGHRSGQLGTDACLLMMVQRTR